MNREKQIQYWRIGAREDWEVARELVQAGRIRHGLFFAHLALEKLLKAHVSRHTDALAPRIHSLLRLAAQTGLQLTAEQSAFLGRFDRFQIEGRYPDVLPVELDYKTANQELTRAREVFEWLENQF